MEKPSSAGVASTVVFGFAIFGAENIETLNERATDFSAGFGGASALDHLKIGNRVGLRIVLRKI